jgi:hypothetical protein
MGQITKIHWRVWQWLHAIGPTASISSCHFRQFDQHVATLLHMDRIIVFDKDKINEDGAHSELLAKVLLYKSLWDAQVGGFLGDDQMEDEV